MSEEVARSKLCCSCNEVATKMQTLEAMVQAMEEKQLEKEDCLLRALNDGLLERTNMKEWFYKRVAKSCIGLSRNLIDLNSQMVAANESTRVGNLKLEIPTFYGGICEGVKSWIMSIENLFDVLGVTRDSIKVSIAICGLRNIAKTWSVLYLRNKEGSLSSWYEFKDALYNRFWNSEIACDYQTELNDLTQDYMDVESYIAKFEELCVNSDNHELNEVLAARFLNGLNSWAASPCENKVLRYTQHSVESNVDRGFQTLGAIEWVDNLIVAIDGGSSVNYISEEFVRANHLEVSDLCEPCKLRWLHGGMELSVTQNAKVNLRIRELEIFELLDVVPMTACDVVLGIPFIKKMGIVYIGALNTFSYRDRAYKLVELRSLSPWESEHIMFRKRVLQKEFIKVNNVQQNKKEGTFVEGESSGGVGGTLYTNQDLSFVHFVASHRSQNQMKEEKVFLSIGGPRLFPFKNRRKFAMRSWPPLKELSPTPFSGNNEVEEESLNQQVSKESSDDFPSN
ncbi:OLC1v1001376C1 [Oldenlandia corymbosa var. corymbosa]|uniref:OLC1v1001376C1 n=1 Tax=Oldenlandia corymbosa var. corymbosa TaxID=529605 RepID=A0AAV1D7X4_OLDCO|nr:OLC1v1001376C1 [Oldenlandia corymbosa var. corymbosa]